MKKANIRRKIKHNAQPKIRHKIKHMKRKKNHFNKPFHFSWKLPTALVLVSLITFIIIIPTLIVAPFLKEDNDHQAIAEEIDFDFETETDTSSLSVAVMRMSSEEIEDVPLETYVARVIASEMPAEFEMEALKAQGLAARTYIVNHLLHQHESADSDVTDTTDHQVYKNEDELRELWGNEFNDKMEKLKKAVAATKGEILTYNNTPITAAYFSTGNGYTENSEDYWEDEIPYLRSVESPWDKESPMFLDQKVLSFEEIEQALNITLQHDTTIPLEISRTESQRVKQIKIAGHLFTGREIREKLDLKSSDFTIEQNNNHLIFTTKGYGHGIGMSQYGANGMAKEGKTYQDIVKYYYKDVEISTVEEIAPTLVSR